MTKSGAANEYWRGWHCRFFGAQSGKTLPHGSADVKWLRFCRFIIGCLEWGKDRVSRTTPANWTAVLGLHSQRIAHQNYT